jgi:hypothetical protein
LQTNRKAARVESRAAFFQVKTDCPQIPKFTQQKIENYE